MEKVSKQLIRYLEKGDDNVSDAVKSWARLYIHRKAVSILSMPFDQRKAAIDTSVHSEMVRVEVIRINNYRAGKR